MEFLGQYYIQRLPRKTISACFDKNGSLILKVPLLTSKLRINLFMKKNSVALWHLQQKTKDKIYLTSDIFNQDFKKFKAVSLIKNRFEIVKKQAESLNLLTDKSPIFKIMQSRWGSCKSDGVICLNVFLGLLPEFIIDAVIAHEFCHLAEMNHSKKFYALLLKLYPNYKVCDKELKKYIIIK